jgi:hypothetical protein
MIIEDIIPEQDEDIKDGDKCLYTGCGGSLYHRKDNEYICTNCGHPEGWEPPKPAKLVVTPMMKKVSKQNVNQVIVIMDPKVFISSTSTDVEGIMNGAKSLEKYNEYAENGDISVMPYLAIDLDTKKIIGHEGRHRAAALAKRHGKKMFVALRLRSRTLDKEKYDINWDDVPKIIEKQQGQGSLYKVEMQVAKSSWHDY